MARIAKPNDLKVPKEYLTGRVTKGLTDEFRASIPPGFSFGRALETALRIWMTLPDDYRLQALAGRVEASLPALVTVLIDERIDEGIAMGKLLSGHHKRKPSAKDSGSPDDGDHAR